MQAKPPKSQAIPQDQAELIALRDQVKKLTEIAGRAQADLQNARARTERDAGDIRKFATETVLLSLLPTIDNFQRAFQHLPPDLKAHEWVKGVEALEQELLRQLGSLGLRRFSPLGQRIDPHRHEILLTGPGAADTVTGVLEDGYELHGKVLRPAKVRVGTGYVGADGAMPQDGRPSASGKSPPH